jgi:replicative DNA helicase
MNLPYSLEAERTVVANVLFEPSFAQNADGLLPEHFYDPFNSLLWRTMLSAIESTGTVTGEYVESALHDDEQFKKNRSYFIGLFEASIYLASEVELNARIIRDLATRRQIISLAESLKAAAIGEGAGYLNPSELLDRMDDAAERVRAGSGGTLGHYDFSETGLDALSSLGKTAALRVPTGFRAVDEQLGGGLTPGQNTILAAGTSVGKSALAVCIALNAVEMGLTVGYFALEMTRQEIAMRGGCYLQYDKNESRNLRYNDVSNGPGDDASGTRLRRVFEEAAYKRLYLDDRGGLKVSQLSERYRAWCNEARRQGVERPRLVIVDNLGNLSPERNGDRTDETGRISKALLAFAKRHDVALLTLHHLNRESIKDERPPKLHDLRQSGEIEQDANAVLFLYREAHLAKQAMDAAKSEEEHKIAHDRWMRTKNGADIIIAKNRSGPLGKVPLACDMASNAFWTPFDNVEPIWGRVR